MRLPRSLRHITTLAALGAALACGKAVETPPVPAALVLVQGNLQSIQGGQELPTPIVVRLLDTEGKPIENSAIGFTVMSGGGSVAPPSVLTDEAGEAKTKWTVGAGEANQQLSAKAPGLDAVTIAAVALLPTDLVIAQGNNQQARVNAALPNPIVIRVVGPNNTPMKGVTVAFQIGSGGGLITPQSSLTNAQGEVTARWTLGPLQGSQALIVSSGSVAPIAVAATATP